MGAITTPGREMLQRWGLDVDRHSRSFSARRHRVMGRLGVTSVIDVGASEGQYAVGLRCEGYRGRILSVEPLVSAYTLLARRCARDDAWECLNVALGREPGVGLMNVAANLVSSSLLPIGARHQSAEPLSTYRSKQEVEVRRLDDVARDYGLVDKKVALKLDVQGYELEVLAGGPQTLDAAVLVDCEVSFAELYAGQPLAGEVLAFMADSGFRPVGVRQGFTDSATDEALQADMLFARIGGD